MKFRKKVTECGIKKLIVNKSTLIVFDTEHNIMFYDILKPQITTDRSSEVEESG